MLRPTSLTAWCEKDYHLSDCTLIVNGKVSFQVNSAALASNSKAFLDTFLSERAKSGSEQVTLPLTCHLSYVDVNAMKDMLDLIAKVAGTKEQLSAADLIDLLRTDRLRQRLQAALEFGVPRLIDGIVSSALCNLTHSNCWVVMAIAAEPKCACQPLETVAKAYALRHFWQAVKQPQFARWVSHRQLEDLLKSDHLNAPQEFDVFSVILDWVRVNRAARLRHFPSLLSYVRLGRLTAAEMKLITTCKYVYMTQPQSSALINWFYTEHDKMRTNGQIEGIDQRKLRLLLLPRLPHQAIFLCGGLRQYRKDLQLMVSKDTSVFDPMLNTWVLHDKYSPVMDAKLLRSGCVELDSVVYVIGGLIQPKRSSKQQSGQMMMTVARVQAFDLRQGVWRQRASLDYARSCLSVCQCAGKIYAIGGWCAPDTYATGIVETYSPNHNRWSQVPSMQLARAEASAASLHGFVYVCGGKSATAYHDTMERYNPATCQWTMMAALPVARAGLSLCPFIGSIFAMGGCSRTTIYQTVYRYTPATNRWSEAPPMHSRRSHFVSCVLYDSLYVIGGREEHMDRPGIGLYGTERFRPPSGWDTSPSSSYLTEGCGCTIFGSDVIEPLLSREKIPLKVELPS